MGINSLRIAMTFPPTLVETVRPRNQEVHLRIHQKPFELFARVRMSLVGIERCRLMRRDEGEHLGVVSEASEDLQVQQQQQEDLSKLPQRCQMLRHYMVAVVSKAFVGVKTRAHHSR